MQAVPAFFVDASRSGSTDTSTPLESSINRPVDARLATSRFLAAELGELLVSENASVG